MPSPSAFPQGGRALAVLGFALGEAAVPPFGIFARDRDGIGRGHGFVSGATHPRRYDECNRLCNNPAGCFRMLYSIDVIRIAVGAA